MIDLRPAWICVGLPAGLHAMPTAVLYTNLTVAKQAPWFYVHLNHVHLNPFLKLFTNWTSCSARLRINYLALLNLTPHKFSLSLLVYLKQQQYGQDVNILSPCLLLLHYLMLRLRLLWVSLVSYAAETKTGLFASFNAEKNVLVMPY